MEILKGISSICTKAESDPKLVRTGNWKAVKRDVDKIRQGATELDDLSNDIGETKNIANTNPEIVKKIEEYMKLAHTPFKDFPFFYETSGK